MELVTQIDISMPNQPGAMAKVTDALRAAHVNIEAMYCTEGTAYSTIHMVVDDVDTAKLALGVFGKIDTTPAFVTSVRNQPGAIASAIRLCAGAGINIRNLICTSAGKEAMIVITVNDIEKAKQVFGIR